MTLTEGQFAPGGAQEGDVWIRVTAGGHRQRYVWLLDKQEGAAEAMAWVGWPPQGGAVNRHLAKVSAAQYHGQWVEAAQGLAHVHNQWNAAASWTVSHNLASRFVDVTVIRALDDWTQNGVAWTDPQAVTRPATFVVPRIVQANVSALMLQFMEPVRGIALVRR